MRSVVVPVRDDARTVVIAYLPDGDTSSPPASCGQAPSAVFGLADCDVLTGPHARQQQHRSAHALPLDVSDPAGPLRTATVDVDAGQVTEVDVPLVEGGTSTVAVEVDGKGLVAGSDPRSCGAVVQDPRARFGQVDCGNVSATVVLDNSRTTHRVRFTVPGRGDVVLAAGETRVFGLHLPIAERLSLSTRGTPVVGRRPSSRWSRRLAAPTSRRAEPAAHCAQGGVGIGVPSSALALKPAEMATRAVAGVAPGFDSRIGWPAGTTTVSPGPAGGAPSWRTRTPSVTMKTSSRSRVWAAGETRPASTVICQVHSWWLLRLGEANPTNWMPGSANVGADVLRRWVARVI